MSGPTLDRVRVVGPLAGFADGYRVDLAERGYSLSGARDQLYLLAQVSRWMEVEGLDLAALTSPMVLGRYVVWRREQGYLRSLSPKSLRGLLGYLDGLGVLACDDAVRSAVEGLLEAFGCYLLQERGLAAGSVRLYERTARRFLAGRQSRWLMIWLACQAPRSRRSCCASRGARRGRLGRWCAGCGRCCGSCMCRG